MILCYNDSVLQASKQVQLRYTLAAKKKQLMKRCVFTNIRHAFCKVKWNSWVTFSKLADFSRRPQEIKDGVKQDCKAQPET